MVYTEKCMANVEATEIKELKPGFKNLMASLHKGLDAKQVESKKAARTALDRLAKALGPDVFEEALEGAGFSPADRIKLMGKGGAKKRVAERALAPKPWEKDKGEEKDAAPTGFGGQTKRFEGSSFRPSAKDNPEFRDVEEREGKLTSMTKKERDDASATFRPKFVSTPSLRRKASSSTPKPAARGGAPPPASANASGPNRDWNKSKDGRSQSMMDMKERVAAQIAKAGQKSAALREREKESKEKKPLPATPKFKPKPKTFKVEFEVVLSSLDISDFGKNEQALFSAEVAGNLGLPKEKVEVLKAEAGSVVVHTEVTGVADQSGADKITAALGGDDPIVKSFGPCEVGAQR